MAIRMGFMQIKGLNKKTTQTILKERNQGGPFRSLQDLLERVSMPGGDGTLLIKSGGFDSLEPNMSRSQVMWTFLAHVRNHSTVAQKPGTTGHLFAFRGTEYPAPPLKDYDLKTRLHHVKGEADEKQIDMKRAVWQIHSMPRLARLDALGVLHHVMIRGMELRKIILNNRDREDFFERLANSCPRRKRRVTPGDSFLIMPIFFFALV